ncbi:chromosomal replication initiator protein DnaA [Rickettsiales endosymbiont of Peranema trichophorum]|uniref:chromosomal replication initiator protein DnaA n=1 Tax=Rickettsiales endosymbiont of Peranema trichophorum TaxID=2486577 RepID=UPI001023E94C|nr:chromosomal replication initiator protein DnaA [Rickettsiales endosymbiont of Peranema trichophorum]RZI47621.1 chromosomal replication initiator protein DnaA [Rickettsiales endosymbiont of Peranema trichophorum]
MNNTIKKHERQFGDQELWGEVLQDLKNEYGLDTFNTWFIDLAFEKIQDNVITVTAPNRFIRDTVFTNYLNKMKQSLSIKAPNITVIDLRVLSESQTPAIGAQEDDVYNDRSEFHGSQASYLANLSNVLDVKLTFDNFMVGETNKLAFTSASNIVSSQLSGATSACPNMLYLYGGVGMGKTHLLQSIANAVFSNAPTKRVVYISSERFMHQYVVSLKNNTSLGFKECLRSLDVLLLDDLQFLCGKNSTQSEFANILAVLAESGKFVVISSDRTPYRLEFDRRTKSRLAGALVVEIKQPNYELRLEILKHKARQRKVNIDESILEFIAQNVTSSVRELEGALHNLLHHTASSGLEINLKNTKYVLKDCFLANEACLTVNQIINAIANYYGFTLAEMLKKTREKRYIQPRQVAAFMVKQLTRSSLKEIGDALGGRNHSTIVYAAKQIEEKMKEDQLLEYDINQLYNILGVR